MGLDRSRRWRRAAASLAVTALATLGVMASAPAATAADGDPAISVSKTADLDPAGEEITVTGTGFTPADNVGTHPPLAGQPSGVYVVFGAFAPTWKPSEGAATDARPAIDQKWAAPGEPSFLVGNPAYVPMNTDGSFTATITAKASPDAAADAVYGVYVYPASGAVNPAQEVTVPITFAAAPPEGTTSTPTSATTATSSTPPGSSESAAAPSSQASTPTVQCTTETVPAKPGAATLDWGVKRSFLGYVGGAAGGTVATGGGAEWNGRTVTWGEGSGSLASGVTFPGTLHLTAHDGVLNMTFSNLTVTTTGDHSGTLKADVASTDTEGNDVSSTGVLATLSFTSLSDTGGTATPTLTAAGAKAFGGFYQAGETLDPLTIAASAGTAATTVQHCVDANGNAVSPDGTPLDELAFTGTDTTAMTLLAAMLGATGVLLLLFARRRRPAAAHRA